MELIAIGKISKPIGIKGEVKITPLTDDHNRFASLQSVLVGKNVKEVETRDVLAVRVDPRQIAVYLSGVENTGDAEKLRDRYLFVPKEQTVKLREGSYFVDDVIGCEVVTEKQMKVGIISDLFSLPSNDIWVVWNGKKEILIPAVKEIIKFVDVEKKRITINAIKGLID